MHKTQAGVNVTKRCRVSGVKHKLRIDSKILEYIHTENKK